jgi:hypothetical protein
VLKSDKIDILKQAYADPLDVKFQELKQRYEEDEFKTGLRHALSGSFL